MSDDGSEVLDPRTFRRMARRVPARRAGPKRAELPTFLLHNSHHSSSRPDGWSGAPGEAAWVLALNDAIIDAANVRFPGRYRIVRVDGDLGHTAGDTVEAYRARHPEFARSYTAFIAPHYEANIHGGGGSCGGIAEGDPQATRSRALLAGFDRRFGALVGVPPAQPWCGGPNVVRYYGFASTDGATPGVLKEHGVGWNVPADYDFTWLRANRLAIAEAWADALAEFAGVSAPAPTPALDPRFSVIGQDTLVAEQLTTFLRSRNPAAPAELGALYVAHARAAGIRSSLAFAQACKETNFWRFTGTARPEWNNPAGLGVTGSPDVGNRFPTWDAGIRAQLGHLLWYMGQHLAPFCDLDQRHFGAHKNLPNDVRQLNGKWAVPGTTYGETIADMAEELRRMPAPSGPSLWDDRPDSAAATVGDVRRYARALALELPTNHAH